MTAAISSPCASTVRNIDAKSAASHSPPNGTDGFSAKKCRVMMSRKRTCMPSGSESAIAREVSPWYPPFSAASFARCGRPFARWYCTAIFAATSTEMDPESAKNTRSRPGGANAINRSASSTAGPWVKPPNITWHILSLWRRIASTIDGWLWPCATHHQLDTASISRRPSDSSISTPLAERASRTGGGSLSEAYGCQTCVLSNSRSVMAKQLREVDVGIRAAVRHPRHAHYRRREAHAGKRATRLRE